MIQNKQFLTEATLAFKQAIYDSKTNAVVWRADKSKQKHYNKKLLMQDSNMDS